MTRIPAQSIEPEKTRRANMKGILGISHRSTGGPDAKILKTAGPILRSLVGAGFSRRCQDA